jgi:transposase
MSRFFSYDPDQVFLLPPNVQDVLGSEHLCFHVHRVVEALEVRRFEQAYAAEGRLAYPPRMMLKVWLYAFALGVTSTRRLEQRIREDLPLRYLAGGLQPDHKTLSEFLRRHRGAINDVFTQVLEMARAAGLGKLGHVAIDSTRVAANASRHKMVEVEQAVREQRARDRRRVRGFQQKASTPEGDEGAGVSLSEGEQSQWAEQCAGAGQGLRRLPKARPSQLSTTDAESRFLRTREGWVLGYTADLAVSDDHLIVATRVTQNATDNASLLPLVEEVQRQCGEPPARVTADSGFFSGTAIRALAERGIDAYVPDNNLKHEMQTGQPAMGIGRCTIRDPEHQRMRQKLRSREGRRIYERRQAVVEPVFGIVKEQRGMRKFRRRGLAAVNTEWMLLAISYNLRRMVAR